MRYRRGGFVKGHYRAGSWIDPLYRSGSIVSPHDSPYSPQVHNSNSFTRNTSRSYGSITFLTNCWWCAEKVYFHRDENGGTALFDELGSPWPKHPCWDEYFAQRNEAAEQMLTALQPLDPSCIKIKQTDLEVPQHELHGYFVDVGGPKTIIELLVRDEVFTVYKLTFFSDEKFYELYIEAQLRHEVEFNSLVMVRCSIRDRGGARLMYVDGLNHVTATYVGEKTYGTPLSSEKFADSKWCYVKRL